MEGKWVGVALALLAATMNATGINLQRLAKRRASMRLALLGVLLSTGCGLVDVASFAFAPQSFLAPFGALSLLVNLLLAPTLHGDAVRPLDLVATALVVCGVALCLANHSVAPRDWSLTQLRQLPYGHAFHAWLAVQAALLCVGGGWLLHAPSRPSAAPCFALVAGLLGGCTVLSAKFAGELAAAGAPLHDLALPGAGVGLFAAAQLLVLNQGVGRHSSLVVVPVFVATFVCANAIGGGLFFEEFAAFTPEQRRSYLQGAAIIAVGNVCLSFRTPDVKDQPGEGEKKQL